MAFLVLVQGYALLVSPLVTIVQEPPWRFWSVS